MLYRSALARTAFRALSSPNASVARTHLSSSIFKAQLTSSARVPSSPSLALAARKPVTTALVRYASTVPAKNLRVSFPPSIKLNALSCVYWRLYAR